MELFLEEDGSKYRIDFAHPMDLSIPLRAGLETVNCFYAPPAEFEPLKSGDFTGAVAEGGVVNFFNVRFNPHGNGTHTECVGHISSRRYTINESLKKFFFVGKLVSIFPTKTVSGDRVIKDAQIREILQPGEAEALIIRTLPNDELKLRTNYSGANPPYLHHDAAAYLVDCGIRHLLIDLPSVDREEDGGQLLAHRAFWQYPENPRTDCTISELIYVDNDIRDGFYLLNIQIASFELDVSPSKPVIYSLEKT